MSLDKAKFSVLYPEHIHIGLVIQLLSAVYQAVFNGRVGLAARSGSLSCTRGESKKGIDNGYLNWTPVCCAVLSPW